MGGGIGSGGNGWNGNKRNNFLKNGFFKEFLLRWEYVLVWFLRMEI